MVADGKSETHASPLEELRQLRGWSRERLAAEAGISLSTIWRVEHGQYPRVEHLIAIAEALGVPTDAVLGRTVPRDRQRRLKPGGRSLDQSAQPDASDT